MFIQPPGAGVVRVGMYLLYRYCRNAGEQNSTENSKRAMVIGTFSVSVV